TGPVNATNIVMTDLLPEGVVSDISNGLWRPTAVAPYVSVTNADDGTETNASWVTFKVVGRNLEFTRTQHDPGTTGTLVLRVRPTAGVAPGTVLSNTASYSYNNGQANVNKITNTVDYTVPSQAIVGVKKTIGTTAVPGAFVYVFEITNTGDIPGTNLVLTDNLPSTVVLDDTVGVWRNFGSTASQQVTVADDGEEANASGITFKVVNHQLTATVANIPAGVISANSGGEFHLRVKPAPGVVGGEQISNEGVYSYNNGYDGVVTNQKTGAAVYTVPAGTANLTLQKLQALDADANNAIEGEYGTGALNANPGTKIFYKLIVTNTGTGAATNVVIEDNVAQYTTLTYGDGSVSATGKPSWRIGTGNFTEVGTKPADGGTGLIKATIPSLGAGETVELFYNVKVDD
ncbi:MAG: hypothetical protein MJH09_07575, partial [Cetobacterium sp.]|nr:hypothetical protein [Cetobacterium sp.]